MDYNYLYRKYKTKYLQLKEKLMTGGDKRSDSLESEGWIRKGKGWIPPPPCIGEPLKRKTNLPPYNADQCKGNVVNGNDDKEYLSVKKSDGTYEWKLIKSMEETKSAAEYLSQLPGFKPKYDLTDVKKKLVRIKQELLANGIYLLDIGWDKIWNMNDYAWDDAMIMLDEDVKRGKIKVKIPKDAISYYYLLDTVSFLFYTDNRLYSSSIDGELFLQFNILPKDRETVIKVFKKYFSKGFKWSGNKQDALLIDIIKDK